MLYLYLITRTQPAHYDEYIGFVVAANSSDEALEVIMTFILTDEDWRIDVDTNELDPDLAPAWLNAEKTIQAVGKTHAGLVEPCVILPSYRFS